MKGNIKIELPGEEYTELNFELNGNAVDFDGTVPIGFINFLVMQNRL